MSDYSKPNEVPPVPQDVPPPPKKDNTIMMVLSYLWILFLIPLLVEKNDPEVQWHAKHGLVLTVLEFIPQFAFTMISWFTDFGACITCLPSLFIWLAFIVVRILCILKAIKGQRFLVPGVSQYADQIKL